MNLKLSILVFLNLLITVCQSQDVISQWEFEKGGIFNIIKLTLSEEVTISFKTRYSEEDIECIEFYVGKDFSLVLFKPLPGNFRNDEYIINAAFKLDERWIQDYQDRSYCHSSTGISSTVVTSCEIADGQTLKVNYIMTFSFSPDSLSIFTEVNLGKYGFHEKETGKKSNLSFYNDKHEMGKLQNRSPRTDYLF